MPSIQKWNEHIDNLEAAYEQRLTQLWQIFNAKELLEEDLTKLEKAIIYQQQSHPYYAMLRAQKQAQHTESVKPALLTPKLAEPETEPFEWRPDMIKRPVATEK